MTHKNFLENRASELTNLMMFLSPIANAVRRGEPMPVLTPDQMERIIVTVGEALLANHRALRAAKEKCAAA